MAAGASTDRKQTDAGAQLTLSFIVSPESQPWVMPSTLGVGGSAHLTEPTPETLSRGGISVCFHGNYKSHQVDN